MIANEVPSVNFHLWKPCNMRCTYCFAHFEDSSVPKGHLSQAECEQVISQLAELGFEKINFAGGEPTLCKWLPKLIRHAKGLGMITSIVTNGSMLDKTYLKGLSGSLDWLALSIDTVDTRRAIEIGRTVKGEAMTQSQLSELCSDVQNAGIKLKINTVVSAYNQEEDFFDLIQHAKPQRWKVLQALPINGENDQHVEDFLIDANAFERFKQRHISNGTTSICATVFEDNELMTGSYVMIDPAGRFFDNVNGTYRYSLPILSVGAKEALESVTVLADVFLKREGRYEW